MIFSPIFSLLNERLLSFFGERGAGAYLSFKEFGSCS